MADQSAAIVKKVEECLKEVDRMSKANEDPESIIALISTTLEEISPDNNPVFEGARLHYKLASFLIDVIRSRNSEEEENMTDLNEDDFEIAWENLEIARNFYQSSHEIDKYKSELSDVLMTLGELSIERGEFDSAIENITECVKYRREFCKGHDRRVADALYYLGLAQAYSAELHALESKDDESLAAKAEELAKQALASFTETQLTLCHVCLDEALKEKLIQSKEENVLEQVMGLTNTPDSVDELVNIIRDLNENIDSAKNFDVKSIIQKEEKEIASMRDLLNGDIEDDEEDEDFEEEEEEEEGDIVVDNVEDLKKVTKRENEEEGEGAKRQKMNSTVC